MQYFRWKSISLIIQESPRQLSWKKRDLKQQLLDAGVLNTQILAEREVGQWIEAMLSAMVNGLTNNLCSGKFA
jgi:hypothetical protein